MEDAAMLAENTSILLNVSEFSSIDEATSALVSTMQAFGYTADHAMGVVDVMNDVGNKFAVSSDGIATALQDSASALMTANNSYEEAVAMIAAANRVVQNPSEVGSALRTISLRLRGTKVSELENMGEDTTGAVETQSKLRSKLKGLTGIDILTDTGAYKSTYDILLEISKVWDKLSDENRAGALELIAGKNRANVASALLSNTKDLEEAYKSALNAEGSALRENEKYLDSIQGKIDQFTNALQTMWNDTLDSSIIKGFVSFGTTLIKIVDTLGLIPSILLTIGAAQGVKKLFNSFDDASVVLKTFLSYINSLTVGFQKNAVAQTAANIATLKQDAANKLLKNSIIQRLASEQLDGQLKELNMAREVRLVALKQALALAEDQYADGLIDDIALQTAKNAVDAASVPINLSQFSVTTLLGAAFKGLAVSIWGAIKAIGAFLLTNPVGWLILATGAIVAGVAAWNKWGPTVENLQEKLSNLKSELSDIRSDLDSLNSELETTQSRMAELLALDTLSFTEEEELNQLKKQNDELEREIYLLEQRAKRKQKEEEDTFDSLMKKELDTQRTQMGGGVSLSGREEIGMLMAAYKIAVRDGKTKIAENTAKELDKRIQDLVEQAEGIDYDLADDKTKEYLDYIYNIEDKFEIIQGGSKKYAIDRILNKKEFASASDEIDNLVEQLKQSPNDKTIIDQIRQQCKLAEKDFQAVGISIEEATKYFTQFASNSSFDALNKKISELEFVSRTFEDLLHNYTFEVDGSRIELQNLFDKEGKVIQTKLSQIFNDTDAQTREDITSILEGAYDDIKNGTADIEELLTKFSFKASRQIINIEKDLFTSKNKELFPNIKDEISGIIDTFDELATAVGNVVDAMDLLDQAKAEEAYSGSVSLETLQNLMAYTDDYAKLVSVDETGAIHLAANAQEILIQEKLNAIKANALLAYEEAEKAYQEALAAETSVSAATTIENMLIPVIDQVSGGLSFLGSLWSSVGEAWSDGFGGKTFSLSDAINKAQSAYSSTVGSRQNNRQQESETTLAQATEALAKAEANLKIAENLTADNVKTRYDSETASGGTSNEKDAKQKKDDEAADEFQKQMEYWENRIDANRAKYDQAQHEIDMLEAKGKRAGEGYYKKQLQLETGRKNLLEGQKAEAMAYLKELESAGQRGSEQWWEVAKTINSIEGELDDVIANVQELNDAIAQIHWDTFEEAHNRFGDLTTDLENIRDILSSKDMFDDQGNWTEDGIATLGTHIQEMEIYKNALNDVKKELTDFNRGYEGNEKFFEREYSIDSEQEYYCSLYIIYKLWYAL